MFGQWLPILSALSPAGRVVVSSAILMLVLVAAGVGMLLLRRWMIACLHSRRSGQNDLKMEQIEALHRHGQISDEEFARLRQSRLGLDIGPGGKDNSSLSYHQENDEGSVNDRQD